jgi:tetratricopeptide (TPR) repeat protein
MTFFLDLLETLAFRSRALRALAARRAVGCAVVCLAAGFLTFVVVRNSVYAELVTSPYVEAPPSLLETILNINLLQTLVFLVLIYVPAVIALSNAIAGDGLGFTVSRAEYTGHLSALGPLWGVLFLIAAPIQLLVPHFLVLGDFVSISVGLLWLIVSMVIYTVWAIKRMNYIPSLAGLAVFVLSWFTLPVYYLLTTFLLALPLFIILPLLYVFIQRFRELISVKSSLSNFRRHLHTLTLNPRNADAHYQLGLLHFRSAHMEAARRYFEQALAIDPHEPEYHYHMGRIYEAQEEWPKALEEYEATYQLNPEYGLGDIFREVGKGYLHTAQLEKAIEFLTFFLERRGSDPQGRTWLAVALQRSGRIEEMRAQLNLVLDQARSNPRFFRKENRAWIYQARVLLRSQT